MTNIFLAARSVETIQYIIQRQLLWLLMKSYGKTIAANERYQREFRFVVDCYCFQ